MQPLIPVDDALDLWPLFRIPIVRAPQRRTLVSSSCRSLDRDPTALVISLAAPRLEPSEFWAISDPLRQMINFVHCPCSASRRDPDGCSLSLEWRKSTAYKALWTTFRRSCHQSQLVFSAVSSQKESKVRTHNSFTWYSADSNLLERSGRVVGNFPTNNPAARPGNGCIATLFYGPLQPSESASCLHRERQLDLNNRYSPVLSSKYLPIKKDQKH